ncbi:MAG: tRNA pseudouridine(38-40) synthase TruA [Candidatus Omnitrophica bacterium]|nr:tRNA pseudouridine(38-40) synthase TruA [Candidatus Omnitrophota bacterium]
MVKNILLRVEYLGTQYFGFQIQNKKGKHEVSIQACLEEALKKLFKRTIRVIYSSRTDREVHAFDQAVNFTIDTAIPCKSIRKALNAFLPDDIRVKSAQIVAADFHARFWAKAKIYRYIILNRKEPSVFWTDRAWHIQEALDAVAMGKAAALVCGTHDFSLFAKEAKNYTDATREVKNISLKKKNSFIHIDIEANGFLRNMARNIVAFLVKVGQGKIELPQVSKILEGKAPYSNKPAPGCGLYLLKVKYN